MINGQMEWFPTPADMAEVFADNKKKGKGYSPGSRANNVDLAIRPANCRWRYHKPARRITA